MSRKRNNRRVSGRRLRVEALEGRMLMAADPIVGLGILGDSFSDEYSDQSLNYAQNWVELLAGQRQVDIGATGSWGEPRRAGFEFDWGRADATSSDLVNQGQTLGVLGQIAQGDVSHVVMMIGQGDFAVGQPAYSNILPGRGLRLRLIIMWHRSPVDSMQRCRIWNSVMYGRWL